MANMSYCRFTNTLQDLRDCVQALEDVDGNIDEIESKEEQAAARKLIKLCVLIAGDYDDEVKTQRRNRKQTL